MSITTTAPTITGVHPYADKFPMLPESELQELAESILQNGLRQPIVVTPDGLILDGRNRAKACEMAGVTPETVVYEGDDLAEFVLDCNVTRRNMSTGARAMSTALVLESDGRREGGRWKRGTTAIYESVNSDSAWSVRIAECGIVLDFKPDLATAVIEGHLALDAAYQQAKAIKDSAERDKIMERERRRREKEEAAAEAERNSQIVADLTQAGSKYLPLIESEDMTPGAAWAAYLDDTKKERERVDQKRRADQQQARNFCDLLARLEDFTFENQRSWTRRCIADHGASLSERYRSLHNPSTIRNLGQALQTYATEMES